MAIKCYYPRVENNKNIEKIFSGTTEILEKGVEGVQQLGDDFINQKPIKSIREYWDKTGPGLVTGASDDDPSGILTYSQAGAQFGFNLLWLSVFTYPFMSTIQEMCARIGIVTGRGLAGNIKKHYSKKLLVFIATLLFIANTFNIGANLGALSEAIRLIIPSLNSNFVIIFFALLIMIFQIYTSYAKYAKYLKYLSLILLAYILSAIYANLDWSTVLHQGFNFNFEFNRDTIFMISAILGTTISPYLFFWQTSQEVEERILSGEKTIAKREAGNIKQEIKDMRFDNWSGMFFSNLVMFFIIVTCGALLFPNGLTNIQTISDAAAALRPFAGNLSVTLFAIGIIGTGLLSIPVLAGSSSYAIAEVFSWKQGLYRKISEARSFYGVIIISMLVGVMMNMFNLNPVKMLLYSAFLNSLVAPTMIFFIIRISRNKKIMGEFKTSKLHALMGWAILIIMKGFATLALIYMFF